MAATDLLEKLLANTLELFLLTRRVDLHLVRFPEHLMILTGRSCFDVGHIVALLCPTAQRKIWPLS